MHLVEGLLFVSGGWGLVFIFSGRRRRGCWSGGGAGTDQFLPPIKQLLPHLRQPHAANRRLPADLAAADFRPHGPSDDLVPETDPDDAHVMVGERRGDVGDEAQDPGRVVERAVSWLVNARVNLLYRLMFSWELTAREGSNSRDPVISIPSISSRFGYVSMFLSMSHFVIRSLRPSTPFPFVSLPPFVVFDSLPSLMRSGSPSAAAPALSRAVNTPP